MVDEMQFVLQTSLRMINRLHSNSGSGGQFARHAGTVRRKPSKSYSRKIPEIMARFSDAQIGEWLNGISRTGGWWSFRSGRRQYSVTCGTGELACGLIWFGMAGGGLWPLLMPVSVGKGYIGMAITIVCFFAGGFLLLVGNRLVVQPRVGYFTMRPEKLRWVGMIVGMAVSGVVAIAVSLWLVKQHVGMVPPAIHPVHPAVANAATSAPVTRQEVAIIAVTGMLNALLYLMVNAVSIRQHRWKWACLVVSLLIPPVIIFWLPGDMVHQELPMNFLQSLIWLASGSATLVWFPRHHQPIAREAE